MVADKKGTLVQDLLQVVAVEKHVRIVGIHTMTITKAAVSVIFPPHPHPMPTAPPPATLTTSPTP